MTEDFPILVGITGEIHLTPDQAARMRARLRACFSAINRQSPRTPKLLLTGGAAGSDLIAAKLLLEPDPAWQDWKIAVLPAFAPELFLKTFPAVEPDSAGYGRLALLELIERSERADKVSLHPMPMLRQSPDGPRAMQEQLDEAHPDLNAVLRRAHYEQLGQFIAETCMILIAVMPPDKRPRLDQANGGTARVVACRRAGRPDAVGTEVALCSDVVRNQWSPLVAPPAGAVWLIDPTAPDNTPPKTVLPKLDDRSVAEVYEGYPGRDMPKGHAAPDRSAIGLWVHRRRLSWSEHAPFLAPKSERLALRQSHHQARMLHGFVRRYRPDPKKSAGNTVAEHIEALRGGLNSVQTRSKTYSKRAFIVVAGLFLAAVLSLELASEFFHAEPMPQILLGLYLLTLLGIGAVVTLAEELHWQPRAEDYRAVTEMLRVQKAWWSAGATARVDRLHLQGAGADLLPIRDLARSLLGLVALRFDFAPCLGQSEDWSLVRPAGPPRAAEALMKGKRPKDWVGDQFLYFAKNLEKREQTASHRNCVTWVLFALSGCLALAQWLILAVPAMTRLAEIGANRLFGHPALTILVWLTPVVLLLHRRFALHHIHHRWAARGLTVLTCLLCAACLATAIQAAGPHLAALLDALGQPVEAQEAAKALTMISFVLLTSIAGAVRFVTERLGLEAEALAYRDALAIFRRAEATLAAAIDPNTGQPHDLKASRALVAELGTIALRENQSWLEAHRERKLSPVV